MPIFVAFPDYFSFLWLCLNAINQFVRNISGKRIVRAGNVFTLFISHEGRNDTIRIKNLVEDYREY